MATLLYQIRPLKYIIYQEARSALLFRYLAIILIATVSFSLIDLEGRAAIDLTLTIRILLILSTGNDYWPSSSPHAV